MTLNSQLSTLNFLIVGEVKRPHGLDGEVSVEVRTAFPERFAPGLNLLWRRGGEERSLTLQSARRHGGRVLLRFEGVEDAQGARALAGGDLCVPVADAVPAPEDFYYSHELEGWVCEDPLGRKLGTVVSLEETVAGPLLSVEPERGKAVLIPFVRPIVVSLDRSSRRVVVDPPEGLLDLST